MHKPLHFPRQFDKTYDKNKNKIKNNISSYKKRNIFVSFNMAHFCDIKHTNFEKVTILK